MKIHITAQYQCAEDIPVCLKGVLKAIEECKVHYPQLVTQTLSDDVEIHLEQQTTKE